MNRRQFLVRTSLAGAAVVSSGGLKVVLEGAPKLAAPAKLVPVFNEADLWVSAVELSKHYECMIYAYDICQDSMVWQFRRRVRVAAGSVDVDKVLTVSELRNGSPDDEVEVLRWQREARAILDEANEVNT